MKKKFWTTLALATLVAFTPTATNTALATAGWQKMNDTTDRIVVSSTGETDGMVISSGGGDFKIELTGNYTGGSLHVELWEDDGLFDDYVSNVNINTPNEVVFYNLNQWVDGDKAEFYIKVSSREGKSGNTYWNYYD